MKIAFISTRGIPNNYGGFEQFAEYISVGLAARGHDVTVYSPHFHPYKENSYRGVKIKHIYSPEKWMGSSIGSFFYDFSSLRDALKNENFDVIYEAGYTSIIPAFIWFDIKNRKNPIVTTNMDGLEYKRSKFNPLVRKFIFWEEKMAVRHSHHLIADNMGIKDYYLEKYGKESTFMAYGADIHTDFNPTILKEYSLIADDYYILVARLEPENNIEMAIEGYINSKDYRFRPLIIVGNTSTPHGKMLTKKYAGYDNIRFIGGIYDFKKLDSLRHYALAYFHGHSVGGTNPSLLEAMAAGCFIFANDNIFNRSVLNDNAIFYKNASDITSIINNHETLLKKSLFISNNINKIRQEYSWERLVDIHEQYFLKLIHKNSK